MEFDICKYYKDPDYRVAYDKWEVTNEYLSSTNSEKGKVNMDHINRNSRVIEKICCYNFLSKNDCIDILKEELEINED